jgi:hypothetical protein
VFTVHGATARVVLGSPPVLRLVFEALRRMRRGSAYRTVLVLDKP